MMRDRLWQVALALLAVLAAAGGAALQTPLRQERQRLQLDAVTADPSILKDPKTVLLQLAPGGLRAPFLNYLWIRSQELKQDEKFFDAKQVRDLICTLMPHFPGVWAFHGWDMAWNISVATHTPQERWMWVYNGVTLLRDKGLYYNPRELILYKELAWIFSAKMGQYTDEMHMTYKRRWAGMMHSVLGGPPITGKTEDVIAAFRAITEAPSDAQGLLADARAAAFAAALAPLGVGLDATFLDYYNRFSGDPLAGGLDWLTAPPLDARQQQLAALMRSTDHAAGRAKVLAFVRRKVLAEQYKMDAAWMLKLMEKYGPLDWRNCNAHAMYWASLGLHVVEGLDLKDIHALNTDRITLNSLQTLSRTGLMYYTPDPQNPEDPFIDWGPDWRFVEPAHQEYLAAGRVLAGDPEMVGTDANDLRSAHIVFLTNVIELLYTGDRRDMAQHYFDEMKRILKPAGPAFELSLDEFVRFKIFQTGTPMSETARGFWFSGLMSAYRALAGGNTDAFLHYHAFARRAYETFVQDTGTGRHDPGAFDKQERNFLAALLVQPQAYGMYMPLLVKVRLYNALPPEKKQDVYPMILQPLQQECQQEQIDFAKAFPIPSGYKPTTATARSE